MARRPSFSACTQADAVTSSSTGPRRSQSLSRTFAGRLVWCRPLFLPLLSDTESTERTEPPERTECTEVSERTEAITCGSVCVPVLTPISSIEEAIRYALPEREHENHDRLFDLARAIKAVETKQGSPYPIHMLRAAFNKWHARAKPFLRTDLSDDDYWMEFLDAYENAKHPLGVDVVKLAWEAAQKAPVPVEATVFSTPEIQKLAALCREMQRLCGASAFFLSGRTVQNLFGQPNHTNAARWLRGLRQAKILEVVDLGGPDTMKATRFRYLPPID